MPDEFKTLLKIEGDATEARKAVAETKTATEQLGDAAAKSEKQSTEAAAKTGEALEDKAKKTEKAKTGFEKMADSMGLSMREAQQFRQVLGRISPELAGLLDIAMKGEGAFKTLFTGIGAAALTAAAAVQMISYALREAEASAARARAEIQKVQELSDEARRRGQTRTEEVSDVLARAGIVSEAATGKGRAIEERMLRQGFSQEAIRAVMPFAVDEAGQQVLTDEELANLAAMEEYAPGKMAFGDPRELGKVLRRARRDISRRPELVGRWRQAVAGRRERQQAGIAQMDTEAIARRLREGPEAVPEGQIDQAVEDIKAIVTQGRISDEELSLFWSGKDRLIWERRQRDAARRAAALGLLPSESAVKAGQMTGQQAMERGVVEELSDFAKPFKKMLDLVPAMKMGQAVQSAATYVFNHGIQVFGKDARDEQIPRVEQP